MVEEPNAVSATAILEDARESIKAVSKHTRLRMPYIKLVVMNNLFRAFITHYEFEPEYKDAQEVLLKALCRVEARKDRRWMAADLIAVVQAMVYYERVIISSTEEQLKDMLLFVEANRPNGKYLVLSKKKG